MSMNTYTGSTYRKIGGSKKKLSLYLQKQDIEFLKVFGYTRELLPAVMPNTELRILLWSY